MLGPLCAQTNKRDSVVKHNEHSKKCVSLNNSHKNGHRKLQEQDIPKKYFRSIDLCVLGDPCYELLSVLGDFYASGMQDTEVKKSLVTVCRTSTLYPSIRNNPMKYRVLEPQLQRRIMSFCFTKIP